MTRKPRSHVRILIYRTWAIRKKLQEERCGEKICCLRQPVEAFKITVVAILHFVVTQSTSFRITLYF